MTSFSVSFAGLLQLNKQLNEMTTRAPSALDQALYREGQAIFRESQRLVPVDKGFLKASGVVEAEPGTVFIGYGGPAASYALYVHEDPEAKHKKGKSYKFLEIPFTEALKGMDERLAPYVGQALEGSAPTEGSEQVES
jgi:hypothetical protein